jgi:hypothetical protein
MHTTRSLTSRIQHIRRNTLRLLQVRLLPGWGRVVRVLDLLLGLVGVVFPCVNNVLPDALGLLGGVVGGVGGAGFVGVVGAGVKYVLAYGFGVAGEFVGGGLGVAWEKGLVDCL